LINETYTQKKKDIVWGFYISKDIKVSKYVTSELYVIIGLTNVSKTASVRNEFIG
jgi:hypothetical protein